MGETFCKVKVAQSPVQFHPTLMLAAILYVKHCNELNLLNKAISITLR